MTSNNQTKNVINGAGDVNDFGGMIPCEASNDPLPREVIKPSDRISLSFSDKKSGFSFHCSISRDVPPGQDMYRYMDREALAFFDKFNAMFDYFSKKNEEKHGGARNNFGGNQSHQKQDGQYDNSGARGSNGYSQQNSGGQAGQRHGAGICTKCGAPLAISKSSGKQYCSALCWKK